MQSNHNEVYRLTSERTGKSEQLYKDIGKYVFKELNKMIRRPNSLIIKLKGIGYWFLRKKRLQRVIDWYPPDYNKTREDFSSDISFFRYENKKEIYELFKERLKEYDKYMENKSRIKAKRNETQVLLGFDKRED